MSRRRYDNIQKELMAFIPESCFFLSLLSVAEDVMADTGKFDSVQLPPGGEKVDLIGAFIEARKRGWLGKDNIMYNDVALLQCLTGVRVTKRVVAPEEQLDVAPNEYTITKYRRGSMTHFRRRGYDVYDGSQTVAKGKLEAVYVYKFDVK